ncbi:MFS transporter [Corynebacterium flavescens]|uniref:MFS transporter n=1 Tax=Corynebacterium flavescens TaxID=28028 RepID=UPI0028A2CEBE|nr:MFS transporter [Corynebacterium flavescens]
MVTTERQVNLTSGKKKPDYRSLVAATSGNILEWYEWSAYAVFAPFIAAVMFEPGNQAAAVLATLGVFAVGFLFRPLGGIVFGWVADRRGRKFVLVVTMLMMGGGSLAIGLMPTHESVGIWAAVILFLIRILQGFAHGGESATSTAYVSEIAPNHRRGMWSSMVHIGIVGGSILAYLIGALLTQFMGEDAVREGAWRIPFLIGAVLALGVLYLRRHMAESEVFEDEVIASASVEEGEVPVRERGAEDGSSSWTKAKIARRAIKLVLFTSGITVAHYTWSSYMSTYAISQGMAASDAYWATLGAQAIALCALPLLGLLSDRVGRKPMIVVFAVGTAITAIPFINMVNAPWWTLFVPQALSLLLWAMAASIFAAVQSENFPTALRTRGVGFAYSMSVALFGGTAPYLNQLLVNLDHGWIFGVYIVVLALMTLVASRTMRETKGIDLRDVV